MNLTIASSISNPSSLTNPDPSFQSLSKTYKDLMTVKDENNINNSKFQTKSKLLKDIQDSDFEEILDDPDIMIYEPNKKPRTENQNINMLASSNRSSNHIPRNVSLKKKRDSFPKKLPDFFSNRSYPD